MARILVAIMAYTTWARHRDAISAGRDEFSGKPESVNDCVLRVARASLEAIDWHSNDGKIMN